MNTLFGYVRMNDRVAGFMQIRLSSCACVTLFSSRARLLQLLTKTYLTLDPQIEKDRCSYVYKASYKWIHKWNQQVGYIYRVCCVAKNVTIFCVATF